MKYNLSPQVWSLAWPMILSNISIPLLGLVDTAVVGHLPNANDIAAVALGTMVFDVLFWCFGFLRMSTTALAAQESKNSQIYYQSGIIAIVLGIFLLITSPVLLQLALKLIEIKPSVERLLSQYFEIRIWSALPTLINYVNYGFFFGRQNTRVPLAILLTTNLCAMVLDYLFVWSFHLGAVGIAWANLITQTGSALAGMVLIYHYFLNDGKPLPRPLFPLKRVRQLFSLNRDIFIRTLTLVMTTAFFTRQSASLGVSIVSANMILMNFQMITSYALDGFAIAAESLVGQAVGKNNIKALVEQIKACAFWSLIFSGLITMTYFILGPLFIGLQTSITSVKNEAMSHLGWVIWLPLLSVPGFLLDGVFIGAAWSKPLRNAVVIASLFVFIPFWYFSQFWGNNGLWLAYTGFICARGSYLGWVLMKKLRAYP